MPCARRMLDRLHERVGRRRLVNRMAEREVDDVDAEQRPCSRWRTRWRARRWPSSPCPFSSSTRSPISRALGATPTYSLAIKPGHVRAVAVRIHRRNRADVAVREVVKRRNAIVEIGARLDARIDHRHADASAAAGLARDSSVP